MTENREDYVLVIKKKAKSPTWLSAHQKRLGEASRIAASKTRKLKGYARIRAMNLIVAALLKEDKSGE